jgi:cation:H+ antiporter|tara:strand:- start:376 stop:1323 length:948 start_codon:yes stop_codon:yes gene_type:complete
MELLTSILWLILSLVLLIWGANRFIDSASSMAGKLGISDFIIGLSVIALGTSFPEIFVGISSIVNNTEEIALGTIVGSNISNIALIFGVSLVGYSTAINPSSKRNFIALGLSVLVAIYALSDLIISNFDSLMLLAVLTYFIYIMAIQPNSDEIVVEQNDSSYLNLSIFLIIGLLSITIGSNYAVINGEKIAFLIGIPKLIIGLTVLAIGTSLPELAVTISALMKQKNQMVLGNIIGSNVLNIAVVMPILGLFSAKSFDPSIITRDMSVMTILSLIFVMIALSFNYKNIPINVYRLIGIILVSSYIIYIGILGGLL